MLMTDSQEKKLLKKASMQKECMAKNCIIPSLTPNMNTAQQSTAILQYGLANQFNFNLLIAPHKPILMEKWDCCSSQ